MCGHNLQIREVCHSYKLYVYVCSQYGWVSKGVCGYTRQYILC